MSSIRRSSACTCCPAAEFFAILESTLASTLSDSFWSRLTGSTVKAAAAVAAGAQRPHERAPPRAHRCRPAGQRGGAAEAAGRCPGRHSHAAHAGSASPAPADGSARQLDGPRALRGVRAARLERGGRGHPGRHSRPVRGPRPAGSAWRAGLRCAASGLRRGERQASDHSGGSSRSSEATCTSGGAEQATRRRRNSGTHSFELLAECPRYRATSRACFSCTQAIGARGAPMTSLRRSSTASLALTRSEATTCSMGRWPRHSLTMRSAGLSSRIVRAAGPRSCQLRTPPRVDTLTKVRVRSPSAGR